MNQNHYDVFYSANKDALTAMLMRALDEIFALNQENDVLNQRVCDYIESGVELREELSQADTALEWLNTRVNDIQDENDKDRETMHRERRQQTDNIVAFVVKRPKPYVFRELFGAPTWLLVDEAVCEDKKILAIKHLRAYSNLTLYDAKLCIDALIESRAPTGHRIT